MIMLIKDHSVAKKGFGGWSWAIDGIVDTEFHFAFFERVTNQSDIGGIAARVLDLAPAQRDFSVHAEEERLFALGYGWFRNAFLNQFFRVIEQHAGRFTGLFVFQDLATEWVWRVLDQCPRDSVQRCWRSPRVRRLAGGGRGC